MADQGTSSLLEVFRVEHGYRSLKEGKWAFPHISMSHSREMRPSASWCNVAFAGVLVSLEPDSGDSSSLRRGNARRRSGVCQWEWKLPSAGHLTSLFYLLTPPCWSYSLSWLADWILAGLFTVCILNGMIYANGLLILSICLMSCQMTWL